MRLFAAACAFSFQSCPPAIARAPPVAAPCRSNSSRFLAFPTRIVTWPSIALQILVSSPEPLNSRSPAGLLHERVIGVAGSIERLTASVQIAAPWLVLASWAVLVIAAGGIDAAFVGDALSGEEEITSDTESRRADELHVGTQPAAERADRGGTDAAKSCVLRSATATVDESAASSGGRAALRGGPARAAGAGQVTTFYDIGRAAAGVRAIATRPRSWSASDTMPRRRSTMS